MGLTRRDQSSLHPGNQAMGGSGFGGNSAMEDNDMNEALDVHSDMNFQRKAPAHSMSADNFGQHRPQMGLTRRDQSSLHPGNSNNNNMGGFGANNSMMDESEMMNDLSQRTAPSSIGMNDNFGGGGGRPMLSRREGTSLAPGQNMMNNNNQGNDFQRRPPAMSMSENFAGQRQPQMFGQREQTSLHPGMGGGAGGGFGNNNNNTGNSMMNADFQRTPPQMTMSAENFLPNQQRGLRGGRRPLARNDQTSLHPGNNVNNSMGGFNAGGTPMDNMSEHSNHHMMNQQQQQQQDFTRKPPAMSVSDFGPRMATIQREQISLHPGNSGGNAGANFGMDNSMNSNASGMPGGGGTAGGPTNFEIQEGMQRLSSLIQKTEMTRHALRNQMRMRSGQGLPEMQQQQQLQHTMSADTLPPEMMYAAQQQQQQQMNQSSSGYSQQQQQWGGNNNMSGM